MASTIKLDEKNGYKPGVNVPMYHISGVELRQNAYEASEYQKTWKLFSPYLVKGGGSTGKSCKKPRVTTTGLRDMTVHHQLCLSTFDQRLHTLLLRFGKHGGSEASTWLEAEDHGFTAYFVSIRLTPSLLNYFDRMGVRAYLAG